MTISTTESSIAYNGNGVTLAFAVPFRFLVDADLVVTLRSAAGVESTLALSTNYTLTGANNDAGGTLTMVVAPAVGERLVISRVVGITQETDYITGDNFPAEAHERALDRLTMISQQHESDIGRSIQFPVSDTASPVIPTSASRANKYLAFDADGNASVASGTALSGVTITPLGESLVSRATEDLMRGDLVAAKSGANTDITSLNDPDIITTQAQDAAGTKVATNYWVSQRLWGAGVRQAASFCLALNDTTGAPDWGGATGSTSLTAAHSGLTFSCAASLKDINAISNSSTWTGLSAPNTTYYLYLDVDAATNAVTRGSTTLAPSYTEGDVYSTVSGQHTFCIPDMQMKVGDGTTSNTVYRLFMGEAATDGAGLVGSFKWYGIRGRATGGVAGFAASSFVTLNHNLGYPGDQMTVEVFIAPTSTTQHGYLSLASATPDWVNIGSSRDITISNFGRLQTVVSTSNSINIVPSGGGAPVAITPANWTMRIVVKRNW